MQKEQLNLIPRIKQRVRSYFRRLWLERSD
jgi:hypothetical protein